MRKEDIELMQRALGICEIQENGDLILGGNFSDNEIMRVFQLLSKDLLSLNIPHYKVIGVVYPIIESKRNSIIRQNDTFTDTFIELNNKLHDFIPVDMGGNDMEKGCYCFSDKPVLRNHFYDDRYKDAKDNGSAPRLDILRKPSDVKFGEDCLFVKEGHVYDPTQIGQITYTNWESYDNVIRPNELHYYQAQGLNKERNVELLIKPDYITSIRRNEYNTIVWITFLYQKGVGILDFSETTKIFKRDAQVFPTRVEYDLTKYLTIPYPILGQKKSFGFSTIKTYVDERVNVAHLSSILRDYAKGLK